MHVITDTLVMGPLVSCFQDILIHGQDIRSVRKSIGDINPDYQAFSDTGSLAPEDFRKLNYAGWGASGLASLTLLNKRAFDIPNCKIHEWRNGKEHKGDPLDTTPDRFFLKDVPPDNTPERLFLGGANTRSDRTGPPWLPGGLTCDSD